MWHDLNTAGTVSVTVSGRGSGGGRNLSFSGFFMQIACACSVVALELWKLHPLPNLQNPWLLPLAAKQVVMEASMVMRCRLSFPHVATVASCSTSNAVPEKAAEDGPRTWNPCHPWERPAWPYRLLALAWRKPRCCGHWRVNQQVKSLPLYVSLFLLLHL